MINSRSAIILLLANLVPVFGVLLFDWQVIDILILYWTESVVIGVINVLRMMRCQTDDLISGLVAAHSARKIPPEAVAQLNAKLPKFSAHAIKAILIPFFIVHYGGFCAGHLLAVMSFFGDRTAHDGSDGALQYFWQREYWLAVAAIAASHMYSYFSNFIGKDEYKHTNVVVLMTRPYGRIIAMHMTIIIGAGLVMWQGSTLPLLFVLIIAKTFLDLRLHEKERVKLAAPGISQGNLVSLST